MGRNFGRLRLEKLERRDVPATPAMAPSLGPPPAPSPTVIWVNTASQLQSAVSNLASNQTIIVQPGTYQINYPLLVGINQAVNNVTIRGATDNYSDVVIRGAGMDNTQVGFGFAVYNGQDVTIANLSVGDVYYHAIQFQGNSGAQRVNLYHCRFFDSGQQIIKSNPGTSGGVNDCKVEYCVLEYTNGPSTVDHGAGIGYTNGVSAVTVSGWQFRNNLVRNFHTPDSAAYSFNPGLLFWQNSVGTIVEGNTFVDCDRAIALGLGDAAGFDHQGGIVRNNFIYQRPGLFSASRRANSDTQIGVNDSPNTKVYHNTIVTSGNSLFSIEVRWGNTGVVFSNNLADAPLSARNGGVYTGTGNYLSATSAMFVNSAAADLHLVNSSATQANVIDHAVVVPGVANDFDLELRPIGAGVDIGADEYSPPVRVQGVAVNDGTPQRSRVTSVQVTLTKAVSFAGSPAAAFALARLSDNAAVTFTALTSLGTGGATIITLANFSGPATDAGSLADGRYRLTALANQISAGGLALDGNGDGIAGDNYTLVGDPLTNKLFRLFGDSDGNGALDQVDFIAFRDAFGTASSILSFDNNGPVDQGDFIQFRNRFGSGV